MTCRSSASDLGDQELFDLESSCSSVRLCKRDSFHPPCSLFAAEQEYNALNSSLDILEASTVLWTDFPISMVHHDFLASIYPELHMLRLEQNLTTRIQSSRPVQVSNQSQSSEFVTSEIYEYKSNRWPTGDVDCTSVLHGNIQERQFYIW
jgi:hypothetical protein